MTIKEVKEMKPDVFESTFEKELYNKQMELEMSSAAFAKYIGMHRTWLVNFRNKNLPKHQLSKKTMAVLHNRLGISFEVMVEYNEQVSKGE